MTRWLPPATVWQSRRVPAGALALVLVISIVISAILLGLVGLYATTHRQAQQQERQQRVQRNARSGLAYVLASPELPYFQFHSLDLFDAGQDSVVVSTRPWGLFEVAIVVAGQGRTRDTLLALLGSRFAGPGRAALYLPDTSPYPLGMAGRSQLRGTAYLPARGAQAAYVPGHEQGAPGKLVTGPEQRSGPRLPLSPDSALASVRDYATHTLAAWLPAGSPVVRQLPTGFRSYLGTPVVWQQANPGPLGQVGIAGQVMLISQYPLVLEATAQLDGVLVLAPKITVQSGFRGRVQLFARDTVDLQAGCQLAYPSAVGVFSTVGSPTIILGEETTVAGILVAGSPENSPAAPQIQMHLTARVQGQVYTNGTVLNCGQVTGTVMCQRLAYQRGPNDSRYDNHLVDAVIDRTHLPAAFLTSPWLNPGAPREVVQWLK